MRCAQRNFAGELWEEQTPRTYIRADAQHELAIEPCLRKRSGKKHAQHIRVFDQQLRASSARQLSNGIINWGYYLVNDDYDDDGCGRSLPLLLCFLQKDS